MVNLFEMEPTVVLHGHTEGKKEVHHLVHSTYQTMDLQIALDLMQLCSTREYGLQNVRDALHKGYGTNIIVPEDTPYLVLLFLEQESPWTKDAGNMELKVRSVDALQFTMAMVQRGVHDTQIIARIFTNLMYFPDLDSRSSHILGHILHLVDIDALVDLLFSDAKTNTTIKNRIQTASNLAIKNRLQTASELCKRTRLRMCRTVIQQLRLTL